MPRLKKYKPSRYSTDRVCDEIEAALSARDLDDKEVAVAVGISQPQFSHKLRTRKGSSWRIEELGLIADFLKAPPGWPFVPWDVGDRLFPARGDHHDAGGRKTSH